MTVFFEIFLEGYLHELDPEMGEEVDLGHGVALFFRKSVGGACVGTFFGLSLVFIMSLLNRRFNQEENVVEVTATIAIAYIGYYTAEAV